MPSFQARDDVLTAATLPFEAMLLLPRIFRALADLGDGCATLQASEAALDDFLADYYRRVLPLSETLEALRRGTEVSRDAAQQEDREPRKHPLDERMKALYRKLIKASHPDCAPGHRLLDAGRIIAAYEEKNIAALWRMDVEYECRLAKDAVQQTRYLELQLAAMLSDAAFIEMRAHALLMSPSWRLRQRAEAAAREGSDLVQSIAGCIQARIHALRHEDADQA